MFQNEEDKIPQSHLTNMLKFAGPSRASMQPPPDIELTGAVSRTSGGARPALNDLKYELPDLTAFQNLIDDPNTDIKDLHHHLTRLMGVTSIMLLQEACSKAPSFNRAQTGSRAVEALRALFTTIQEREKNLYKDRLDFDNPRFQYFVDSLWDLIEEILKDCGLHADQVNNFFLLLQSRLPAWEEKTKKTVNSVSFNASKHGDGADRSEEATLINAKRSKGAKKIITIDAFEIPKPPTPDDHA